MTTVDSHINRLRQRTEDDLQRAFELAGYAEPYLGRRAALDPHERILRDAWEENPLIALEGTVRVSWGITYVQLGAPGSGA